MKLVNLARVYRLFYGFVTSLSFLSIKGFWNGNGFVWILKGFLMVQVAKVSCKIKANVTTIKGNIPESFDYDRL